MYTTSDDVPPAVTSAVDNAHALLEGNSIHDALSLIESAVFEALNGFNVQTPVQDDCFGDSDEIFDDFNLDGCDTYDAFEDEGFNFSVSPNDLRPKLRRDLRAVKNAGFKAGYLGQVDGCITLSIASRIARLGISEEAMKAWNVCPSEYLVLLIRYNHAYQTLEDLFNFGDQPNTQVQMRVGLCDSYKPSLKAAVEAFQTNDHAVSTQEPPKPLFRGMFIGSQLDKLLNERFFGIVKIRLLYGLSWTGTEHFFHDGQGRHLASEDAGAPEYLIPDTWATPPPAYLLSDHLADAGMAIPKVSLPLLVLQFTLRHFVRCTEFCLVCHCKKYDDYETLKPYVCSSGLCLYQYITFGMGPSLEYEIIFQPYVVDLLVSLAYVRAKAGLLKDFPTGLGLQVPNEIGPNQDNGATQTTGVSGSREATLDPQRMELLGMNMGELKTGDWLAITKLHTGQQEQDCRWHARVQHVGETMKHVVISYPIQDGKQLTAQGINEVLKGASSPVCVKYAVYNKNLDDFDLQKKRRAIVMLLCTLPNIDTMTQYLKLHGPSAQLSSWCDRISPAALDLLRWIVASNRSCIRQDSDEPEHLVSGMGNFIQFRLVQGAPDKEQRFLRAIDQHAMSQTSPTIFAWHGSPLQNWHSILREGLHYKQVSHGRAYGDGVYMSNHFGTSSGYSSGFYGMQNNQDKMDWPQTMLKIRSVISLNEVVNATNEFAHVSPHYVVTQLDWIQPRYLFVGTPSGGRGASSYPNRPFSLNGSQSVNSGVSSSQRRLPASSIYQQDPKHAVYGPDGRPVKIPISAFSSKRRGFLAASVTSIETNSKASSKKKKKTPKENHPFHSEQSKADDIQFGKFETDEVASIMTAIEDLNILLSDSEEEIVPSFKRHDSGKRHTSHGPPLTDFVPGTLQEGSLPLLSPPQYATTTATKLLQKHLQATLKVQGKEPLHELGWYVDPTLIKTVYQWIVELHTFPPHLPLAGDLKKANLQSVILELRFPPQFPMDPPFVRVIRPRFLAFSQGGGGHVTLGGALCMELLTNSGWSAVTSIESLLLQVRLAICSTDPQPGRLANYGSKQDYGIGEAVESYKRACHMHGWVVPKDMARISW